MTKPRFTLDQHRATGRIVAKCHLDLLKLLEEAGRAYPKTDLAPLRLAITGLNDWRSTMDDHPHDEHPELTHPAGAEVYYPQ